MQYDANGALIQTEIPGLKLINRGKVRDVYDLGDALLFVATDRLSAFDVVMPNGVPRKGEVLTQISLFWFDLMRDIPNHLISADVASRPELTAYVKDLQGRSMIVRKAKVLPVECIVRGYLVGSGGSPARSFAPAISRRQSSTSRCSLPPPRLKSVIMMRRSLSSRSAESSVRIKRRLFASSR